MTANAKPLPPGRAALSLFIMITLFGSAPAFAGETATRGQSVNKSRYHGDFRLVDTMGRPVSLATYQGKWLLLFFGFTNCPGVCPLAMNNVEATLTEMGAKADGLQPIFITLDPKRDTPKRMKDYLANFSERIAGLTGTAAETSAAARAYGIYFDTRPINADDYTIDHGAPFCLVSPQGEFVRTFPADLDPVALAYQLTTAMSAKRPDGLAGAYR